MKILYCDNSHSDIWDSFLQDSETASFYHLFGWKNVNEKSFNHKTFYLAACDGDEITGVLPLVFLKSYSFGKILCSMPFLNYGGPCILNHEAEELLIREAISIVNRYKMDFLEIRGIRQMGVDLPTSEHKVSLTVKLSADPEELWKNFKTKHRTDIRRAYKNNLGVQCGSLDKLDIFYSILSENWRNLGTPIYQKKYFENIICQFPDLVKIFIVYNKDIPIAAAFNGYYNGTVEGMWAGIRRQYRKLNPNYILYWEMMKHACENGYEMYHLGRSTIDTSGETYKKKWNAYQKQLYWQYYLGNNDKIPQLNVDNPRYQFAIKTWQRIPLKITNFIGPYIAKNIP